MNTLRKTVATNLCFLLHILERLVWAAEMKIRFFQCTMHVMNCEVMCFPMVWQCIDLLH